MRKVKNILIVLSIILIMVISGCGKSTEPAGTKNTPVAPDGEAGPDDAVPAEDMMPPEAPDELGMPGIELEDDLEADEEEVIGSSVPEVRQISVIAKKYEFVPSVIPVNKGETVRLSVRSIDVEHAISIPDFNIEERLLPNQPAEIEFIADEVGIFEFRSSGISGPGSENMVGRIIVE